jgi:hypothetical protein
MNVFSYGAGTNSTAAIIGAYHKGIDIDLILFADTGGERPFTYAYIELFSEWLKSKGLPEVITVRVTGELLEENCIRRKALPAVAYGFKTCSLRWKIEPQEKYLNNYEPAKKALEDGGKITKFIGIDAGESHRARQPTRQQAKKYINAFPLLDWGWDRGDCIKAIEDEGLPLPGKSSCYFCPNMRTSEIKQLAEDSPDLMARAIAMEDNADLTHIAGLGRSYSWSNLIATDDMFGYGDPADSCMACYDG